MNSHSRLIRLVEVCSDVAGRKRGASLGIEALKSSCKKLGSKYFEDYIAEAVEVFGGNDMDKSRFKNAKHIDHVYSVISKLASKVKSLRDEGFFPVVLAGDHSSCAGTMHGLKMAHPDDEIGVVYIDAHADMHSPYTSKSGNMHGMPLSIACGIDNDESKINNPSNEEIHYWDKLKKLAGNSASIKTSNIVFCALRDCENEEIGLINKYNIPNFSVEEITYLGVKKVVKDIFEKLSHCKHIYVSFDVDSVDPRFIPGTGTPVPNGLSYEQALQLNLELIKNKSVCCWEIVEINPLYNERENDTEKVFVMLERITDTLIRHY